ncbi:hypothetical protein MTO96_011841 [Rhipicephalus appendiculatus]
MSTFAARGQPRREETALLLKNLELLHITSSRGERYEEDDFLGKNTSATVRDVLYGLFNAYDKKEAQKKLKNVWPVKLGETEKEFREAILSWFSTLKENHAGAPFLEEFNSRVLLQTGTSRCSMFLTELSTFVLENKLKDEVDLAGDAVPLGAFKFSTRKNTCSYIALQAEQISNEEQNVEIEGLLKQWASFSSTLLRKLSLLEENEMPDDGPTKKLQMIDKELTMWDEVVTTRIQQVEEWLARQDGVIPIDLISELEKCHELSKQFFKGYDQKANGDQHLSAELASKHKEFMNKSLERIHAKRETLEKIQEDIRKQLDEAQKSIDLVMTDEPLEMQTGLIGASDSVEDLAGQLADALMCGNTPQAPENT